MVRGRTYVANNPNGDYGYTSYGITYSGLPAGRVSTATSSKIGSEVIGSGIGDNDFSVNGHWRMCVVVYRTASQYGTYVDWVTWGVTY
jgi:hypothetical protein